TTFVELSAGRSSSCGFTKGGAAYCWGNDSSGQLGNGPANGPQHLPSLVLWPTAIQGVIPDPRDLDPSGTPASADIGIGETLTLGDGLVSATFDDPSGGTADVLLAKYVDGYQKRARGQSCGTGIVINGSVYEVHFAATASTGPGATLAV